MPKNNIIKDKSYVFALRVIKVYKFMALLNKYRCDVILYNFWIASFLAMTLQRMAVRPCEERSNPEKKTKLYIISNAKFISEEKREFVLSKQMLRSGTAIGALIREAEYAQSRADFSHKMNIALKEANETEYRLMLLKDCNYIIKKSFESIYQDCAELIKLLISIVKTTKNSHENKD